MSEESKNEVVKEARELLARARQNGLSDADTTEIALDYIKRSPSIISALCDEVERLRSQQERESTCVVCDALLLTTEEPPHCLDCYVTDEDRERWEEQRTN